MCLALAPLLCTGSYAAARSKTNLLACLLGSGHVGLWVRTVSLAVEWLERWLGSKQTLD